MLDPPNPPTVTMGPAGRLALGAGALAALALGWAEAPRAQVPTVLQGGPPAQVIPTAPEPGIPLITINPGTANPFAGLGGGLGPGGGGGGDPSGGGGGGGGNVGPSSPLTTMLGTSWGSQAVDAAQSLGVNPSAVAATCVLESGCRPTARDGGAEGVFQMFPAAFNEGLATALRANPALASQIVQGDAGRYDPVTSSIAAAGYQIQAAQYLQQRGVDNPTVLDTRGYYQFGGRYAVDLAQAPAETTMGQIMPNVSPSVFSGNGITPNTTVGQWRTMVSNRIGNAAGQSVRI